jgi:hypothetical protein
MEINNDARNDNNIEGFAPINEYIYTRENFATKKGNLIIFVS